jgi:hypothetical protein
MPNDVMQYLRFAIQVVHRFKWIFIGLFYMALFATLQYRAFVLLVPFFILSALAYVFDKEREAQSMDDFSGGWLFFRYGEEVDRTALTIPVKPEWGIAETQASAEALRMTLAQRIASRLPEDSVQVLGNVVVTDRGTGEQKEFLRVRVCSRFGSMLTHFVHYAAFGRTITAHYFTYIRGTHNDWAMVKFVLASPFTIWFWGVPWLLNRYSVIADISWFRASSFDGIDLQTMYSLTNLVVYEETSKLLEEAGLLTEEIRQAIYNITYNKQNISVRSSPGMSFSGGNQSISAPLPVGGRQPAHG